MIRHARPPRAPSGRSRRGPHSATIRVAIVDDHQSYVDMLRRYVRTAGMQVIGTAATGADTLELLATQQPDVLVLDIGLPDANGVELAARLHRAYSGLTILLLTGYTPRDVGSLVGHQGVRGYVHKTAPLKELVAAIRAVAEGRRAFVPGTALLDAGFSSNKLTERERKVWTLLVRGQHNAEIAAALQLSLRTTERCLQGLRAKVGVRSTRELRHNADARGIAGGP